MLADIVIHVILIPCAVMVGVLVPFWLARRSTSDASSTHAPMLFAAALGAALAYMAGHWSQNQYQVPDFPPGDVAHWLFYVAPLCALAGLFESFTARRAASAARFQLPLLLVHIVIAIGSAWLILTPIRRNHPDQASLWLVSCFLLLLLQWESWAALARKNRSYDIAAALFAISIGTSGVLALSGGARYALLSGTLTALCGAIFVGSLLFRDFPLARGLVAVVVPLGGLLVILGNTLTEVPLSSALLLAAAPFSAWFAQLAVVKRLKPWQIALIRFLCVAIPVGIALGIAVAHQPQEDSGYGE